MTKILWVVAAALINDRRQVLLTQRPAGKNLAGYWEFPGGKIEQGETPREALVRELKEELDVDVDPACLEPCSFASFDYPEFHLVMPLFICRRWSGIVKGKEGQKRVWLDMKNVGIDKTFPLPAADFDLAEVLRGFRQKNF